MVSARSAARCWSAGCAACSPMNGSCASASLAFAVSATVSGLSSNAVADLRRADDRRRQLGDDAVALQRDGAVVDAALGRWPRPVALPDGDVRRHGGRQLGLGCNRRNPRPRRRIACFRGGDAFRRTAWPMVQAAGAHLAQPRPAEPVSRTASGAGHQAAQRTDRHHDRIHHPRGEFARVSRHHGRAAKGPAARRGAQLDADA